MHLRPGLTKTRCGRSGGRIGADRLHALGVVNRVAAPGSALADALALGETLNAIPGIAPYGGEVAFTLVAGECGVDFVEPPQTVDATTEHGDIVISLPPPGPYFVDATTALPGNSAVVEVPQTRDRANAAAVITGRAETGDVVVNELG